MGLTEQSPGPSRELSHLNESTYLGHLLGAEQPRELQGQHPESGLGRPVGDSRFLLAGLAQSPTMARMPLASQCPSCFTERGQREETQ